MPLCGTGPPEQPSAHPVPPLLQLKNSRRQVADLLRNGKAENARIRVESVMREEQMLQAYEGNRQSPSSPHPSQVFPRHGALVRLCCLHGIWT